MLSSASASPAAVLSGVRDAGGHAAVTVDTRDASAVRHASTRAASRHCCRCASIVAGDAPLSEGSARTSFGHTSDTTSADSRHAADDARLAIVRVHATRTAGSAESAAALAMRCTPPHATTAPGFSDDRHARLDAASRWHDTESASSRLTDTAAHMLTSSSLAADTDSSRHAGTGSGAMHDGMGTTVSDDSTPDDSRCDTRFEYRADHAPHAPLERFWNSSASSGFPTALTKMRATSSMRQLLTKAKALTFRE